jgi:CBS domain-containing protein
MIGGGAHTAPIQGTINKGPIAMLRLNDIMTRDVVTLDPEMTLREAMDILTARHVGGAPVLSGKKVVGVLSAGDLLSFVAAPPNVETRAEESDTTDNWEPENDLVDEEEDSDSTFFTDMWDERTEDTNDVIDSQGEPSSDLLSNHVVEEAMTKTLRWLSPKADVRSAADMMKKYGIHRVLVVSRGQLVGIVSAMDIAKAVADAKLTSRVYVFNPPD